MPIGEPEPRVAAGLGAQSLVTSPSPVVTPNAVSNLVDAFRQGFVTADDIINRVGELGASERKATIQKLQEFVSPESVQARKASEQLAGATAKANLELLPTTAQVTKGAAEKSLAEQQFGVGTVDAFDQLAEVFHDSGENKTMRERAHLGSNYRYLVSLQQMGREGSTADSTKQLATVYENGKEVKYPINKLGQILTDHTLKLYRGKLDYATKKIQEIADRNDKVAAKNAPAPTEGPVVSPVGPAPSTAENNAIRGAASEYLGLPPTVTANYNQNQIAEVSLELAKRGVQISPTAAASNIELANRAMGARQNIQTAVVPDVVAITPTAPVSAPAIVAPVAPTISYTKPVAITDAEKQVTDFLTTSEPVKALQTSLSSIESFKTVQQHLGELERKGEPTIAADKELGRTVYNLYKASGGTGGTARTMASEFKGEELGNVETLPEKVRDSFKQLLKKEALSPEGRTRLIEEGNRYIDALQKGASGDILRAQSMAKAGGLGVSLDTVFGPPGTPLRTVAEGGSLVPKVTEGATPRGTRIVLPTGRVVYRHD